MDLLLHIADRFVIHFFAACSLVLMVTMLLLWLHRTKRIPAWLAHFAAMFVGAEIPQVLALAAISVFAFASLREAYDVWNGQPLVKAFTDYASWLLGTSVSAWGLYRFRSE